MIKINQKVLMFLLVSIRRANTLLCFPKFAEKTIWFASPNGNDTEGQKVDSYEVKSVYFRNLVSLPNYL
jgi:hypothetical protein